MCRATRGGGSPRRAASLTERGASTRRPGIASTCELPLVESHRFVAKDILRPSPRIGDDDSGWRVVLPHPGWGLRLGGATAAPPDERARSHGATGVREEGCVKRRAAEGRSRHLGCRLLAAP